MKCIHTLKKANEKWLWVAVDRDSRQPIAFELGDRSRETLKRLKPKLEDFEPDFYRTDKFSSYHNQFPKNKHIKNKRHTCIIENLNGRIRHYLARFTRRTKRYSKSYEMIRPC